KVNELEERLFEGHCRVITGSVRAQWKMRPECRERIRLEESREATGQYAQIGQRLRSLRPQRPGIPSRTVRHPPPELLKSKQGIHPLLSGNKTGVYCADRGANDPIGLDAAFVHCLIHTGLIGAERSTPLQDQDDLA